VCVLGGARAVAAAPPDSPPNILLVLADDLTPGMLGFEGNRVIHTPNFDRLAGAGTFFRRAYVPIAQCAPSRAALLAGRYPHDTGVLTNHEARWNPGLTSLAQLLQRAGYRTGFIGKWHLGSPERPQAGFEDFWRAIDRRRPRYEDPDLWVDGALVRFPGHMSDVLTDRAIEFIDADDHRPFFLWLACKTPHRPLTQPPTARRYDPASIPLPASIDDDLSTKPGVQRLEPAHMQFRQTSAAKLRRQLALYYAMINALDTSLGRLLGHLETRGLAARTLVVFASDNGLAHGAHQMTGKGAALYEELVRTPLVVRGPGVPAGRTSDALVSTLDLFPTLALVAGVDPAAVRDARPAGIDLRPLIAGSAARVRDALYLEYFQKKAKRPPTPVLGVVTEREKYVRYRAGDEEELYDLAADPHEMRNLIRSPAHGATLARLRSLAEAFRATIPSAYW
jgi:N-acetylglucosamine-6-sulfatase